MTDLHPDIAAVLVGEAEGCVVCADCLQVMPTMAADSIDTIITDPPYGLKFMGKEWDHGVPGVPFWEAAFRVAKPGAFLLAFGGTRTFHRLTCAIEDAGWEIRDCIMWLYGSGFPKSLDISKAIDKAAGEEPIATGNYKRASIQRNGTGETWDKGAFASHPEETKRIEITAPATDAAKLWDGWGTALKPAWEPIIVAMKPLDGTFANNALTHGVAGLNIDGGRVGSEVISVHNAPVGTFAGGEEGRGSDTQSYRTHQGRWPANVILDEHAAAMLDEQSGESKSNGYRAGGRRPTCQDGYARPNASMFQDKSDWHGPSDTGGASRFFYWAKASRAERGEGNNHPCVKPLALMEYLCRLTMTPTGGIVLDPFTGSGSTLIAARNLGRPYIGIELNAGYVEIAKARLRDTARPLFTETANG